MRYNHKKTEPYWQAIWLKENLESSNNISSQKKYFWEKKHVPNLTGSKKA